MGHPVEVSEDPFLRVARVLLSGGALPDADLDAIVDQATASDASVAAHASKRLFRDIVEPLADRFEPALSGQYERFFAAVLYRLQGRPAFARFNERRAMLQQHGAAEGE